MLFALQQYLPFTVLKQGGNMVIKDFKSQAVATVLTVYGIETLQEPHVLGFQYVATVLTVYGIETIIIINSL